MLKTATFLDDLATLGLRNFYGVPDSLLSSFIASIQDRTKTGQCRLEITADEGAAIGLAIGSYLGSGERSVVFMQNSGLGNAVNPLTSLAHPDVYGVPMLMIIGWRGEMLSDGQLKDEPQHVFQGKATLPMLDVLHVPHLVIGPDMGQEALRGAVKDLLDCNPDQPVALVVRKGSFSGKSTMPERGEFPSREAAIAEAARVLPGVPIVATTGKIGREVYEAGLTNPAFLTVGGMGHSVMIASGIALETGTHVACFDGDGAILMHTGSLANSARVPGLIHVAFNNQMHESVGGQTTAGPAVHLADLARVMGYENTCRIDSLAAIEPTLAMARATQSASFIEIMVAPGSRDDLGRPKETPQASKTAFMEALRK